MRLFVCLLTLTSLVATALADSLLIGAFNVQVFGQSKMDKPHVVEVLVDIVERYDVLMIQEIRDSKQTAFPELVGLVNDHSPHQFKYVTSGRTGRTSSKEQYGYIYRTDKVEAISEYQFPDNQDVFEREPYTVQFRRLEPNYVGPRDFSYVSLHAKPDDAVAEIDALVEVYDVVAQQYGEDALLAGDFNADCNYVCSTCWGGIDLWTDDRFTWLLGNSLDTTVSSTDCAYDRLVVAGKSMTDASRSAQVFRFDLEYGLDYQTTKDVSDHYPVEFYLD